MSKFIKMTNYKRIPFSSTQNARDLGGYATLDGGVTRWNVFFRSGLPVDFTKSDVELLRHLGIKTFIDLRAAGNASDDRPSDIADGIKRCNFPLGNGAVPYFAKDVAASYMEMLQCAQSIKNIFDTLASETDAVLFHCFAGKDRTGVVAALILMLANVADVDIVADYCQTYAYFLPRLRADFNRTDAEKYVFVPIPEHMECFLSLFRNKYCDVRNFLKCAGVTEKTQTSIIEKFVQYGL